MADQLSANCRHSGNGGPQTCLPAACGVAQRRPSAAHIHQHKLKTLTRGQASRGGRRTTSSGAASSGRLARRRRDQGEGTSRGAHDASHDDRGRRAPGKRRPAQCPCFLFGAKGASTGQGIRQRLPFRCNKTKTSRVAAWRSPWSPRRRHR